MTVEITIKINCIIYNNNNNNNNNNAETVMSLDSIKILSLIPIIFSIRVIHCF